MERVAALQVHQLQLQKMPTATASVPAQLESEQQRADRLLGTSKHRLPSTSKLETNKSTQHKLTDSAVSSRSSIHHTHEPPPAYTPSSSAVASRAISPGGVRGSEWRRRLGNESRNKSPQSGSPRSKSPSCGSPTCARSSCGSPSSASSPSASSPSAMVAAELEMEPSTGKGQITFAAHQVEHAPLGTSLGAGVYFHTAGRLSYDWLQVNQLRRTY